MHETYDQGGTGPRRRTGFPVRLGIIGGGQLARMTASAALPLGVDVVVLEKNVFSPALRLSPDCVVGDWADRATLLKFAERCDLVTLENEFVDAEQLKFLEAAGHEVFPSAACLAVVQDKFVQKSALQTAGLSVPRFCAIHSGEDLSKAGEILGWPLVLKTRRNGYDGKGNFMLKSGADISRGWQVLDGERNSLMAEALFPFVKELAVMVTRGRDGGVAIYPVVETIQREHVCRVVKAPAEIPEGVAAAAAAMAKLAVETVGGVGSFGVEMFLSATGALAINELAPRVHNSGHYSIEACHCSQFENHVRAVLGWPLGLPTMLVPAAVMVNLLGTERTSGEPCGLDRALGVGGARVHLYGKLMSGPGRKMGHLTVLGPSVEKAQAMAEHAAQQIYFGGKL